MNEQEEQMNRNKRIDYERTRNAFGGNTHSNTLNNITAQKNASASLVVRYIWRVCVFIALALPTNPKLANGTFNFEIFSVAFIFHNFSQIESQNVHFVWNPSPHKTFGPTTQTEYARKRTKLNIKTHAHTLTNTTPR